MEDNYLVKLRDRALKQITEGKNLFNQHKDFENKKKGFDLFRQGMDNLLTYGKQEPNEEIKKLLREKLNEYTTEAQNMKQFLNQMNANELSKSGESGDSHKISKDASKKNVSDIKEKNTISEENDKLRAGLNDAIVTEKPNVKWEDVAGLENAKKALQEAVILPIKFPQIFTGSRKPWKGILLYGPPGTGKTFLAKACATECDGTFFSVSSSDLISKYVGESEKLIRQLFTLAREKKPSIIFIDEIDSMASARTDNENDATRRVKTEFLVQMQGVGKDDEGILVLGATNIPWGIDAAVRRRFEKRIYIPLPDYNARLALLRMNLKKTPNVLTQEDFEYLAGVTEGFSGSDISVLVRDASFEPLRKCESAKKFKPVFHEGKKRFEPCPPTDPEGLEMKFMDLNGDQLRLPDIDLDDFNVALSKCKPSVSKDDLIKQEKFTKDFGQEG